MVFEERFGKSTLTKESAGEAEVSAHRQSRILVDGIKKLEAREWKWA